MSDMRHLLVNKADSVPEGLEGLQGWRGRGVGFGSFEKTIGQGSAVEHSCGPGKWILALSSPCLLVQAREKRDQPDIGSLLWLILAFIFLPTALLWYTAVQHWFGGQWTLWPIVGIVVAIVLDVSLAESRRRD